MSKPRLIAFYLPQYYPTPYNDKWWGKGFTEWTNVAKARPLFRGHYQPHIPADLGFYDLRLPEIREAQADLAREYGIEGFCYWHYWFNGKRLLDTPFNEVLNTGNPDFPFCLCWANHSWYKKTWTDKGKDTLLVEQTYPGIDDFTNHFYALLPAFKDKRYMKIDGKLIFGIFSPLDFDKSYLFFDTWNELACKNGLSGFYFIGFNIEPHKNDFIFSKGFDGIALDLIKGQMNVKSRMYCALKKIQREYLKLPQKRSYKDYIFYFSKLFNPQKNVFPVIVPNFDHSPRSGTKV